MRRVGNYPLWVGNARDARDIQGVLAVGTEAIVDVAAEEPPVRPTRELVYLRFPLIDGDGNETKLLRSMLAAVTGLLRERVPTLVACSMGMSRGPTVAAVAFAAAYGLTPAEALKMIPGPADVSPTLLRELQRSVEELA